MKSLLRLKKLALLILSGTICLPVKLYLGTIKLIGLKVRICQFSFNIHRQLPASYIVT